MTDNFERLFEYLIPGVHFRQILKNLGESISPLLRNVHILVNSDTVTV